MSSSARAGGERAQGDSLASPGRHGRISNQRVQQDASAHSAFGAPASAAAAGGGASAEGSASVPSAGVSGEGVELPQARTNADRATLTTIFKLLMTKVLLSLRCHLDGTTMLLNEVTRGAQRRTADIHPS
jgi:hypothetical protein